MEFSLTTDNLNFLLTIGAFLLTIFVFYFKVGTFLHHGSRFHTGPVEKRFVRIGWESPLSLWGSILGTEIRSYISPAENVNAYSNLGERWHLAFCKPSSIPSGFYTWRSTPFTFSL